MDLPDIPLLRLQYEILNVPIETIASQAAVNVNILKEIASREKWVQKWPDADELPTPPDSTDPENLSNEDLFNDDPLMTKGDEYIDRTKKRLAAYLAAKDVLLAQRYFETEVAAINRTVRALNYENLRPEDIKHLVNSYNILVKNTSLGKALQLATDEEGGLPTLVLRDLSNN